MTHLRCIQILSILSEVSFLVKYLFSKFIFNSSLFLTNIAKAFLVFDLVCSLLFVDYILCILWNSVFSISSIGFGLTIRK